MNTAADRPAQAEQSNAGVRTAKLLIDGKFVESTTQEWRDIVNPATQEVLAACRSRPPTKSTPPSHRRQKRSRRGARRRSARACASC